jgi:outer membrane lipoprotein-sorting protein
MKRNAVVSGNFFRMLLWTAIFACAAGLPSVSAQAGSSSGDADALLAKVDKSLYLESNSFKMVMETTEPGAASKGMTFEGLSRKGLGTYFEVIAPARTAGTRFLQTEGSLWMFNPKAGSTKALRLSARDSFQGSTFSNSDVGKNQFSDDYSASLGPDETLAHSELGKVPCTTIVATAKNEEAAYSKIVMWLRKSDDMPLKMEYYARSGLLFKRMELSKITKFGTITRPAVMRMESLEKKGTITTLKVESFVSKSVADSFFNKNYLTR